MQLETYPKIGVGWSTRSNMPRADAPGYPILPGVSRLRRLTPTEMQ